MPKVVDLKINRKFINTKFEKYQYISENIPIIQDKTLSKDILQKELSINEYSWLEIKLFSLHNYLFKNPFNATFWFINNNYELWQLSDTGNLQLIKSLIIPNVNSDSMNYNPTISFASKNVIVISKGDDTLDILIQLRNDENNYQSITIDNVEPGVLLDSFYSEEKSMILIAVYKIQSDEKNKKQSKVTFLTYLIKNHENKINFQLDRVQNLLSNGSIEFLYINFDGNNMDILSQDLVKFTDNTNSDNENIDSNNKSKKYSWSQDESFITMSIEIPEKFINIKPKINITATSLDIKIQDFQIKGQFQFRISDDATTWNWDRNKHLLKIELMKDETGLMWMNLIDNDDYGEYLANPDLAQEIHTRLSHLCSDKLVEKRNNEGSSMGFSLSEQLEECDLQGKDNVLQKINLTNQLTSHLIMLSPHNRILFAEKLSSSFQMCVRNDNDGLVWKLPNYFNPEDENKSCDWNIEHVNSFPGFGYIEAGKTNKKFSFSTPNGKYVAIIEHKRYGFVYEIPYNNGIVGKQRVIDLGSEELPIIGAGATNEFLFLLSKNKLYQLKL